MTKDYWFEGLEPIVYELVDGQMRGPLKGIIRHHTGGGWLQIIDAKPVAFFEIEDLVFKAPKGYGSGVA